jgi:murein DD-endopeptidase MepM/ murein hydrolase activator NlpD
MEVLKISRIRLAGSVGMLALAVLMAGCSADTARFDDGFYTGAVPKQPRPRADVGQGQAYPGTLDQVETGSVARYGNNPGAGVQQPAPSQAYPAGGGGPVRTAAVERTMLPPPSAASAAPSYEPAPAPVQNAAPVPPLMPAPSTASTERGWHRSDNQVTLRNGETIDTLATRYGVPAKAILSTNGLSQPGDAVVGQQISIPTYSYGGPVRTASDGRTLGAPPAPLRPPSAARPAPEASQGGSSASIVVESGDSLMGIARRTGVSVADLKAANNLETGDIKIGQKLRLPGGAAQPQRVAAVEPKRPAPAAAAPVAKAAEPAPSQPKPYAAPKPAAEKTEAPAKVAAVKVETPAPVAAAAPVVKAETPSTTVSAEEDREVATAAPSTTGIDQFRWPVQGRVVKRYGEKNGSRRNDGLDISVPRGTPVKAAENGVVIYAGDGLKEFGNTVLIKHDNGLVTVYGHADTLKVKRGATVRRGEEIATAGVSGDTETPMVHFEVRKNSAPVDPSKYLQ